MLMMPVLVNLRTGTMSAVDRVSVVRTLLLIVCHLLLLLSLNATIIKSIDPSIRSTSDATGTCCNSLLAFVHCLVGSVVSS